MPHVVTLNSSHTVLLSLRTVHTLSSGQVSLSPSSVSNRRRRPPAGGAPFPCVVTGIAVVVGSDTTVTLKNTTVQFVVLVTVTHTS